MCKACIQPVPISKRLFYCTGNNLCLESSDSKIIPLLSSWIHALKYLSKNLLCYGWSWFLFSPVAHEGWNQNRAASGRCREHGENLDQIARQHFASAPGLCLLTQQRRTPSSLDCEPEGIRMYQDISPLQKLLSESEPGQIVTRWRRLDHSLQVAYLFSGRQREWKIRAGRWHLFHRWDS